MKCLVNLYILAEKIADSSTDIWVRSDAHGIKGSICKTIDEAKKAEISPVVIQERLIDFTTRLAAYALLDGQH
jgi:hypothetical protein